MLFFASSSINSRWKSNANIHFFSIRMPFKIRSVCKYAVNQIITYVFFLLSVYKYSMIKYI